MSRSEVESSVADDIAGSLKNKPAQKVLSDNNISEKDAKPISEEDVIVLDGPAKENAVDHPRRKQLSIIDMMKNAKRVRSPLKEEDSSKRPKLSEAENCAMKPVTVLLVRDPVLEKKSEEVVSEMDSSSEELSVEEEKAKEEKRKEKELRQKRKEEERLEKERRKKQQEEERKQKEEERQRIREEKEQKRREKEEAKEKERLEKEAKSKAKEEEQRQKEEEKRKADEAKQREEEAKLEKAKKQKNFFAKFFVKVDVQPQSTATSQVTNELFKPFALKDNMKLAPRTRAAISDVRKSALDNLLTSQTTGKSGMYLQELKDSSYNPGSSSATYPVTKLDESDVQIMDESTSDIMFETHLDARSQESCATKRGKLLQFDENRRPPYFGTWRKNSKIINPRNPFKKDPVFFDYEVDSDDEWEDEDDNAESLKGDSDEEKESEDDYEIDNDFFVPHGYLSDDEGDGSGDEAEQKTDERDVDPDAQEKKLRKKAAEFEEELKRKTTRLHPILIGPLWSSEEHPMNPKWLTHLEPLEALLCCGNTVAVYTSFNPPPKSEDGATLQADPDSAKRRKRKRSEFPDEAVPQLVKHLYARSSKSKVALANEFGDEWVRETALKGLPIVKIPKLLIVAKLKEIADWDPSRGRWLVKDDVRKEYPDLADLEHEESVEETKIKSKKRVKSAVKTETAEEEIPETTSASKTAKNGPLDSFLRKGAMTSRLEPLASSIGELQKRADVEDDVKKERGDKLIKSLEMIYKKADEAYRKGDLEMSYVFYYRTFTLLNLLRRSTNYRAEAERRFGNLSLESLNRLEELQGKLEARYEEMKRRKSLELEKQEKETVASPVKNGVVNGPADLILIDAEEPIVTASLQRKPSRERWKKISCDSLARNLEGCFDYSILILDCRPSEHFLSSHILHERAINIPADGLNAGVTTHKVETLIPPLYVEKWRERHSVDLLVLCDWDSDPPSNAIQPRLAALLKSLSMDEVEYKSVPMVLQGGYEMFARKFPKLTTHPDVARPEISSEPAAPTLISSIHISVDPSKISLNTKVSYPKLTFASSEAKKPKPVESTEETDVGFHRFRGHHRAFADPVPAFDRSSKPKILEKFWNKSSTTSMSSVLSDDVPLVDRNKKPPELVASLSSASEEKNKIEEDYLREMRAAEEKEKKWILLANERKADADGVRIRELQDKEESLLRELEASEKNRKSLEREQMHAKNLIDQLRARLRASGESPPAEETVSEKKQAKELRKLEIDLQQMRKERKEIEWQRREQEEKHRQEVERKRRELEERQEREREEEKRRRQQSAESERLKRIEEEKKRKIAEEEERIKSQLAMERRKEEMARNITKVPLKDAGGGLRRSHSSPSIDQLGLIEERSAVVSSSDRQLKRESFKMDYFMSRRRNFAEVHGNTVPGRTGLKNLGNTCYMNATIQCLGNTPFIWSYFHEGKFFEDLNAKCDTKGEVAKELYLVFRHLWSGNYRNIAIYDFKELVGRYYSSFAGSDQQDCHEFLVILLAWLRDDVNKIKGRPASNLSLDIDKIPNDIEAATAAWKVLNAAEQSIFVDSFGGLQRSTLVCQNCNDRSRTFEPIFELSLPLPSKNRCTLENYALPDEFDEKKPLIFQDCIREYLNGEFLSDRECPKCHRKGHTVKKFNIWKFPHILVIHLKRFEKHAGRLDKKLQNFVDFQLDRLDLGEFPIAPEGAHVPTTSSPTKFDLFAVTNHYGTMDGGHYTAYCKNKGKTWCKYDDQSVREMPASEVKSSAAYVLYFAEYRLMQSFRQAYM
ncbi:unnamed protein product [Notodromas monacha]|uniref:ubiquitinyl hydrolase 1 n=1 Tax=Notodromas monacha TaxID=399045 RepID=A0A7R9BS76_9CRUS|nr:unnamed protein product [Notodromas monacha]CAG0919228.1 unnamed protein product [Notodromas monacha]